MEQTDYEKAFLRGLVEFLFAVIIVLTVVVSTKEDKSKEDSVKLAGRYLITMRWPQPDTVYQNDDVDLHVIQVESGEHAWFASPSSENAYISLETPDDTGNPIKFYTDTKTGELVKCDAHEERSVIHATMPGEIAVICHMYNKRWTGNSTKVIITLVDLQKGSQKIIEKEVELLYTGEQKVAFRFTLNEFGDILPGSVNERPYTIGDVKR